MNIMKTDLSKFDNSWYDPGGNSLKKVCWYFVNTLLIKNHINPISSLKVALLRLFGAKIGEGVVIKPGVNIKYPWLLEIGDFSWVGEDVWIDNLAKIHIGPNCCISQGAMLLCGNHNYKSSRFDLIVRPITLEEGAWIGAKSIVCPGVTIKSHGMVSVGSVVTKDIEAYTIMDVKGQIRKRVICI